MYLCKLIPIVLKAENIKKKSYDSIKYFILS